MEPKIIIEIENGTLVAIHSNVDLQYIVIDRDVQSLDEWIVGLPNTPDTVDANLTLSSLNYRGLKDAEGYKEHPWK